MQMDFEALDWESSIDKRKEIIQALTPDEIDAQTKEKWQALLQLRYVEKKKTTADLFVKFWLDLFYYGEHISSGLEISRAKKDIGQFLNNPDFVEIRQYSPDCDVLVRHELANALMIYYKACLNDRSYATGMFGLKKLSPEQIFAKIQGQTDSLIHALPPKLNMGEDFQWVCTLAQETHARFEARAKSAMAFL